MSRFEYLCAYTRWVKQGYRDLEAARMISFFVVKMNADPAKFKAKSPAELMPFATDHVPEKPKVKAMTEQDWKEQAAKYNIPVING